MQLVVARYLRHRRPTARIAIHTPHPDDDRSLYEGIELVHCSRRLPLRAIRTVFAAQLWRATRKHRRLSPELQSYRDASLIIDLSGDGLTETFGWKCPLSHTMPLLYARLMGVPYCLLGQTIGPFGRLAPWLRYILRNAALITARDAETYDYLARWNLGVPLHLTADLAFLLEPAPVEDATNYLRQKGPYDAARPLVGVTPSNLYNIQAIDRPHAGAAPETVDRAIAGACTRLAAHAGVQIVVIPHVFGPGAEYDDRRAARRLVGLVGEKASTLVVDEPLDPGLLKAIIGRCGLLIGTRMHSVIAAVSQGIPTLALAYSPKALHLMRRLNMPERAVSLQHIHGEALAVLVADTWKNRGQIRDKLRNALDNDLLPAARRNVDLLKDHILPAASTPPTGPSP